MTFFGELSVIERLVGGLEICAAVLPVGVEKQRIELAIQIIMVRGIETGAWRRIELLQAAMQVAQHPLQLGPDRRPAVAALAQHDGQHVGDRALLYDDAAIHVSFAEPQLGIDENAAFGCLGGEADRYRLAASVSAGKSRPSRGSQPESPRADQIVQCHPKQPIHRPPPVASPRSHSPRLRHNYRPPASVRIAGPGFIAPAAPRTGAIKTNSFRHGNLSERGMGRGHPA